MVALREGLQQPDTIQGEHRHNLQLRQALLAASQAFRAFMGLLRET